MSRLSRVSKLVLVGLVALIPAAAALALDEPQAEAPAPASPLQMPGASGIVDGDRSLGDRDRPSASRDAIAYVCGGGPALKTILTLEEGEHFELTDVTVANTSGFGRSLSLFTGAFPPSSAGWIVNFGPRESYSQQFDSPIVFTGPAEIKAFTGSCLGDNFATWVTISGRAGRLQPTGS